MYNLLFFIRSHKKLIYLRQTLKSIIMETNKNSLFKSTLTLGATLGIALIIYSILLYILNLSLNKSLGYISYVIIIGGLYFAIKQYRDKEQNGFITYGKALGVGALVLLFASIIASIYTYIFFAYIDPNIINKILEMSQTKLLEKGMSDDQIQTALQMSAKFMKPGLMAIFGFIGQMFFGFILTLIVAAFLKKEQNLFATSENNNQ
jgi:hypothetical protein